MRRVRWPRTLHPQVEEMEVQREQSSARFRLALSQFARLEFTRRGLCSMYHNVNSIDPGSQRKARRWQPGSIQLAQYSTGLARGPVPSESKLP